MNQHNWYESIIAWFAENSVAANLLMVVLLSGGLVTAFTIKKAIQPRVEINFVDVSVPYLGAAPEEVEEGVCVKIEEAIQDLILPDPKTTRSPSVVIHSTVAIGRRSVVRNRSAALPRNG